MNRVLGEGEEVASSVLRQVENRKEQVSKGIVAPISYQSLVENPGGQITRTYADRAINREIDQILSIIRSQHSGESYLNVATQGTKTFYFDFDKYKSEKFHSIVSRREVGSPVIYAARVRELDRGLLNGKIVNLENNKTIAVHFLNESDFVKAHPYLGNNQDMVFIGSPIIEYGAFDPNAGDIYFTDLLA